MRYLLLSIIAMLFAAGAQAATDPAPAVEWQTEQGQLALQDLRGKVVYVDFWASWCTPCRKSFPWMQRMQSRYADAGLAVVAVNLDSNRADAQSFLRDLDVNFQIAYDPEGKSAERFQVMGMPSSYLIDRQGRIRARHVGFLDKNTDKNESALQALLQE